MIKLQEQYPWPKEKPNGVDSVDHGFFHNPDKVKALQSVIKPEYQVLLEIGAWLGQSTRILLEAANPQATVISIDHWKGSAEHYSTHYEFLPVLYETFLVNCWQYRERLIPVRENSLDGLRIVAESGVKPDLILVDGSHEYEDVLKDIQTAHQWFPEAVICGDDYNWVPPAERCFNPKRKPTDDRWYPVRRAVKAASKHHRHLGAGFWMIDQFLIS